ncbi:MAG: CBS domain-containing protein [Cyclobacteriaceae bacterium]
MNFTPKFYIPGKATAKEQTEQRRSDSITKYMATQLVTFTPEQNVSEVLSSMLKHRISGAPVLDENGDIIGMISEKDCMKVVLDYAYHNQPINQAKVRDYMSTEVTTVNADASIFEVADLFYSYNFRRFPVMDAGRLVGQISRRDILKAAQKLKSTTW